MPLATNAQMRQWLKQGDWAVATARWIGRSIDGYEAAMRWEAELDLRERLQIPMPERIRLRQMIIDKFGEW